MSTLDDMIAAKAAKEHSQGAADSSASSDSPVLGWGHSALSTFGEMIGLDPTEQAEQYRNNASWLGSVSSQVLPYFIPAIGSEMAVSRIPALAKASEGALTAVGLGANAGRPVLRAAGKLTMGQVPFEVGRAAIGTAVAPEENLPDLYASSALGLGGTAALGMIGGWLTKSGGKAIKGEPTGALFGGSDEWAPGYALRQARELGDQAKYINGSPEENQLFLRNAALSEGAGFQSLKKKSQVYTGALEGSADVVGENVNKLFQLNKGDDTPTGWDIRNLHEGAGNKTLGIGEQDLVSKAAGYDGIDDLVSDVRYPRRIVIADEDGAKAMRDLLDHDGGFQFTSDGTWIGHNADNMAVFAKKLKAGAPEGGGLGIHNIAKGDEFLVGMTDKADRLVPQAANFANRNVEQFAKMKAAYRPGNQSDIFSKVDDELNTNLTPKDIDDMRTMKKDDWIKQYGHKLSKASGLEDGVMSESARRAASQLFDKVAPTAAKQRGNRLFARLFASAQLRNDLKEGVISQMFHGKTTKANPVTGAREFGAGRHGNRPVEQILNGLTEQEQHLLGVAGNARVSLENLSDVIPENMITDNLRTAIAELRKIDKDFLAHDFLPTFKGSKEANNFIFDENFIMPSLLPKGFSVPITDAETGKLVHTLVGKTKSELDGQLKGILDEADKSGRNWKAGKVESDIKKSPHDMEDMMGRLREQMATSSDKEAMDVIHKGIKNYQSQMFQSDYGLYTGKPRNPLGKANTTKRTAGDVKYTGQEIMEASKQHRRDLLSLASDYGFRERYTVPMGELKKMSEVAYDDMQHKLGQFAGLSGKMTRFIDEKLDTLLGASTGGKSATQIANFANKAMWAWNIGIINPTNAIVNILTPLTVLPGVMARAMTVDEQVFKNLFFVGPKMGADGRINGMNAWVDPLKLTFKSMRDAAKPSAESLELMGRAVDEGVINKGVMEEMIGTKSRFGASMGDIYREQGAFHAASHALTWMSRKSEEFSQVVAFNAGINMGKMMGLEGDDLYRMARQMKEMGAYGYHQTQRSKVITGPIGSVMGLFKNFQIHYIDNMLEYSGAALRGENFAPLFWQQASTLSIGGLGATPLVNLADGMANWATDNPTSYAWMQDNWSELQDKDGNNAAVDGMYFGLAGLMGGSLQANVMMPGTDISNDLTNFSNVVLWERIKALGTAVGTGWDYAQATGHNPLANSNIRDQFVNATMPRAAIRAMAVVEGDYIKSMQTGYASQRDVDPWTRVMYGVGLTPTEVAEHQVVQRQAWKETEARRETINMYGRLISNAWLNEDWDELTRINRQAIAAQVPIGSAYSSARTMYVRDKYGTNLSRYSQPLLTELQGGP